ncbi:hypothetical protein CWE08_11415 [Aliidiomarina iranensis]|uniref:Uncharacterized protein n=1 Tax=Aliidiomarina iranensis TaxID=1434071 RepID=A0A432VQN2_9GAMM|nr:FxLYD domain-containing protein [Aliidiomarina iranensis]RUO18518.1 hypothetical protein CWE08_11415 [Aliidiomarina iranensis]
MIKKIGMYIGIGFLIGLGFSIASEIHYWLVKNERKEYVAELHQYSSDLQNELTIDSSELFMNNVPDRYFDPKNDLFFSIQSFKDLGEEIEVSGVVTNLGNDIWTGVYIEFESYTDDGNLIAQCLEQTGRVVPLQTSGVVVRCAKVDKFKTEKITSLNMRIKWNFHGRRVLHNTDDE